MLSWRKDKKDAESGADTSSDGAAMRPERSEGETPPDAEVRHPRRRLGEILVEEGILTAAQLEDAVKRRDETGGFIGQALVDLGYIDQRGLMSFLVKQCKIPHINLSDYEINQDLLRLVPEEVCLKYHLLPIDKLGKILTIAMVDPLDIEALEEVRKACPDLRIKPILCDWNHLIPACNRLFKRAATPSSEVTASSFGLTERKAPPKKPVLPQKSQDEQKALDDAAKAVLKEAAAPKASAVPPAETTPPPVAGPTAEELTGALRESVRDALRETLDTLAQSQAAAPPSGAPGPSPEELAAMVHDSVAQAMDAAAGRLLEGLREAATPAGPAQAGPTAGELSEAIQRSLQSAMEQAVGLLSRQLTSNLDRESQRAAETREALAAQAAQQAQLLQQAVESLRSVPADAQPPRPPEASAHDARLAELTEALTRAVQGVEEAVRETKELAAQRAAAPETPADHPNVHAFPSGALRAGAELTDKAELDVLEALDGPGMRMRADERVRAALESEQPLPGYIFGEFMGGEVNSFTVKLCKAVATQPGPQLSPFYLYGDVGLGKTHLLNAIGNNVVARNPDLRVGYVSASMFARKYQEAERRETLDAFRDKYCGWGMLILDDLQFLANRPEAQEEFFHIFNTLFHEERQILIAGDRAPDLLEGIDKRLVSRFGGGVVASLRPPERETRIEILRHIVVRAEANVPDEILTTIAARIPNDIRKMSGALRKVIAYAKLVDQEITRDLADEILSHLGIEAA